MNSKTLLTIILLPLFLLTSCISSKKTIYMQERDAMIKELAMSKQLPPYRVQVSDVLSVRVKALDQALVGMFNPIAAENNVEATSGDKLFFDGFLIDDHGDINMPTLGKMNVLNLTIDEIKEKIEKKLLEDYFKKEANIFVTVKLGGIKYVTFGEIGEPGTKIIYQERLNIFEAIANSGDIPILGNKKEVMILRPYPGGYKIHELDLTDRSILESPFFYIQPNDMIYIKPLPQKSWGTGKTGLESFTTVLTVLSAITTTVLLLRTL